MARTALTVLHLAVGLTIWFTLVNVLVLSVMLFRVEIPDALTVVTILAIYSYFLLPVRWALVLTLLLRTARAQPFKGLPRAALAQVTFLVVVQVVLGFLSVIGFWALWTETGKAGDHVMGFVMHVCVPAAMVLVPGAARPHVGPAVPSERPPP